jgi:hypothetical protein
MKKLTIMGVLLVMAAALFAQNRDSRTVWQGTNEGVTPNLTYHLEVWERTSTADDPLTAVTPKLQELRRYGALAFLVHARDGYLVALYASPSYEPQLVIPNTTKKYGVVANSKATIREALSSRTFREHITRSAFLEDLSIVYNSFR